MHSTQFTRIAQEADERGEAVIGMFELTHGKAIVLLENEDIGRYTVAKATVTEDEVTFTREESAFRYAKATRMFLDRSRDWAGAPA